MNRFPILGMRSLCIMLGALACLMTINLNGQTAPQSNIDFACQDFSSTVTIYPLDNDQSGSSDFDMSSFFIITPPNFGTAETKADGSVTYLWNGMDYGMDVFSYEICNTEGLCTNNNIDVFIKGGNTITVEDDHYVGLTGMTLSGNITKNDFDTEGDNISLQLNQSSQHGVFTLQTDGSFTYKPNANYTGYDFVSYTACDDNSQQACATGIVHLYLEPVKLNDAKTLIDYKTSYSVVVDNILSANALEDYADLNVKNEDLLCLLVGTPLHGTVQVLANGDFSYQPNIGYVGSDAFEISICDVSDMTCIHSKMLIKVLDDPISCSLAPIVIADDVAVGFQNGHTQGILLANDLNLTQGSYSLDKNTYDGPRNGTAVINADGTFVYTPDPGFFGTDQFDYEVALTDTEPTFEHHVVSQPLDEVIMNFNTNSTLNFDAYGTIHDINVINLSVDHDDVSQTAIQLISPQGTSRFLTVSPCNASGHTFTEIDINLDDEIGEPDLACPPNDGGIYQSDKPLSDFNGEEANGEWRLNVLNYQPGINDGTLNNWGLEITTIKYESLGTRRATASVLVMPIAKRPVALPDCYEVTTGATRNVNPLVNDFDENYDIDPLSVKITQGPTQGTATVEPDGTISYMTNVSLNTEEITYEICDTLGLCDESTIKFTSSSLVVGLDMLSFRAKIRDNETVVLDWTTANETDVAHFEIERRVDDRFVKIDQVAARNKTSNAYSYLDRLNNAVEKLQYRLKAVDEDGSYSYSEIRTLTMDSRSLITVGPNPARDYIYINHNENLVNQVTIRDAAGRYCADVNTNDQIDISGLRPGNYFITVITNAKVETLSFIKI